LKHRKARNAVLHSTSAFAGGLEEITIVVRDLRIPCMDMKAWLIPLAMIGGMALPLQIGINTQLRRALGVEALQVAAISFAAGALAAVLVSFALRLPWPTADKLAVPAWWMWVLGGCCGVFYVWTTIVTGPTLGAALAVSLVIAGQMAASLVFDHYGLVGFPVNSLSPLKALGAALVVAGAALIAFART
jgi:bacterial/archaeal transporter family-2 protein